MSFATGGFFNDGKITNVVNIECKRPLNTIQVIFTRKRDIGTNFTTSIKIPRDATARTPRHNVSIPRVEMRQSAHKNAADIFIGPFRNKLRSAVDLKIIIPPQRERMNERANERAQSVEFHGTWK